MPVPPKKKLPFLPEIPLYPTQWEGLRTFLVAIRQRVETFLSDPGIPGQVEDYTVTVFSSLGSIEIVWEPVTIANSYRIHRNTSRDLETATVIGEVFGQKTARFVDNISAAGTYYYWITAINALGIEGPTLDLTGITGAVFTAAPTTATYILASSDASLPNARVVQDTSTITFDTATAGILKAVRAALSGDISASAGSNTTAIGTDKVLTTHIADNQITTNKILANAVTADKISVTDLAAINADMGSITAGDIVLPSGGFIRSGQTAYDTGTGFYLGNDGGTPKFSIGNSGGNKLTWDGSTLGIIGAISGASTVVLSSGGHIRAGQTAYDTGTGFYLGNDSGTPKFSIGNASGDKLTWDGSALTVTGAISGGTITGTTFKTAGSGNNRVEIDSTNGLRLIDSSDVTQVQLNASTYAGILVSGIRAKDSSDLFLESATQNAQLFVNSSTPQISFSLGSSTAGHFQNSDVGASGGGNWYATALTIKTRNGLRKVYQDETAGSGNFGTLAAVI